MDIPAFVSIVCVVATTIVGCADCTDSLRANGRDVDSEPPADDSADGGPRPGAETNAGVPGECQTDADCRSKYEDVSWPYIEKDDLACLQDSETGLGFCSECTVDEECPDDYLCHLGRFCWPADPQAHGYQCASNADCKAEDDRNDFSGFSPLRPIRCIPIVCPAVDCLPLNEQPTRCSQCESDAQCGAGGKCVLEAGRCHEVCEDDDDCPFDAPEPHQWRCVDPGLCTTVNCLDATDPC